MFEVHLDMDGVLVDLYAEPWREAIEAEDHTVFLDAAPLCNMERLRERMLRARRESMRVVINTHTPDGASPEYQERVRLAKVIWLAEHVGLDSFDRFVCTPYGTDKSAFVIGREAMLVDDSEHNRKAFEVQGYEAYDQYAFWEALDEE